MIEDEKVADDLKEAYKNFDPLRPLSGDSKFYIEREDNPLDDIKTGLLNESFTPPKFLFSGHRGSGKSTELNKLLSDEEIQSKYFIVHYSVREVLDIAGLDYTDLLLSIGAQIFIKAVDAKLKLKKGLLDELNRWKATIEKEVISEEGVETKTELGLQAFFVKAMVGLKVGFKSREKIRETIEPQLSELISIINNLIAEVKLKAEKDDVLVAIDDLDKPDLEVARTLFYERASSLTLPECTMIYTIPIALLYSSDSRQIIQAFTDEYVLPNVTITKHENRLLPDEIGQRVMKNFALKRMLPELIEDDALEYAISISGGVFREMARIMRIAASKAFTRGEDVIQKQDIEKAASQLRNEFRRMLETKDYTNLANIYETRELKRSDICADLLHNLSILEYRNDESWCDVHPIVVPLIEE